jgi:adenylosuccinate lyase
MKVWKKDINFKEALLDDSDFIKSVKPEKISSFFDVTYYTKHVSTIFKKVGI